MSQDYTKALISYFETLITPQKLKRIDEVIAQRTRQVTVVLEESYHDANVSAMLRSAESVGVQDIHLIENYNQIDFKIGVARGSDQWLSIYRHAEQNASEICLSELKNQGYLLIATVPDRNAMPIYEVPVDGPVALIFGNERLGISQIVRQHADMCATIPMVGFTESLNVSVAAGIIIAELIHRLKKSRNDWQLSQKEQDQLRLDWLRLIVNASEEHERRFLEQFTK